MQMSSAISLEQLFVHSENAVFHICNRLHARDIFALEMTNCTMRNCIWQNFWRRTNSLIVHDCLEWPLGPLSAVRLRTSATTAEDTMPIAADEFIVTNRKMKQLLKRCQGGALTCLDLSCWQQQRPIPTTNIAPDGNGVVEAVVVEKMSAKQRRIRWRRNRFYVQRPLRIGTVPAATRLVTNITAFCTKLRLLDLSHIPLAGKLLVQLCRSALGQSLQIVRLQGCFNKPASCAVEQVLCNENGQKTDQMLVCMDYAGASLWPVEWSEFLARTPNLLELDISCNECFGDVHSFANLSTAAQFLNTRSTKVHVRRLVEALSAAGRLRALHAELSSSESGDDRELVEQFFCLVKSLEQLWLWIEEFDHAHCLLNFMWNTFCENMCSLRLCFNNLSLEDDDEHHFQPAEGRRPCFPRLEELYLSGGGKLLCSQFLKAAEMPSLTRLFVSYQASEQFNDTMLTVVARKCRQLKEVRFIFCTHISWKGFATLLDHCPHLQLLEGTVQQMTDELLALVMDRCDSCWSKEVERQQKTAQQEIKTAHQRRRPLFYFLRVQHQYFWGSALYMPSQQQQSQQSQNMHPFVVYSESEGSNDGDGVDSRMDMHLFGWPITNSRRDYLLLK